MSRSLIISALTVGILTAAPSAQAYEAGDFLLRAGPALVDPDDSSSALAFTGKGPLAGSNLALPGTAVSVGSNTQLGITGTYMLAPHIGLGLLASTPFRHDIGGGGSLSGAGKFGETRHLPPTLTVQYFPMDSASRFQPYAGIGVNYTIFFEEKTTPGLTAVIDSVAANTPSISTPPGTVDGSKLDLENSVGVAAELGFDYMLDERFGFNVAVWWADIDSEATITAFSGDTAVGDITTDVEIDPLVYMAGFTYRF
jgi:outer membrane protein